MSRRRKHSRPQLWIVPTVIAIGLIVATLVVAWPALLPGNRRGPALPRLGELVPAALSRPQTAEAAYAELLGKWHGTGRDEPVNADIDSTLTVYADHTLHLESRDTVAGSTMTDAAPFEVADMKLESGELVLSIRVTANHRPIALRCRLSGGVLRTRLVGPNGRVTEVNYTKVADVDSGGR